jgi:uncharacterized protein YecE (DUF72 family)
VGDNSYRVVAIFFCMKQQLRIGTSGFHYKHWLGTFYPEKLSASKMFDFYMQHFDTVEINNTFYKLPKIEMLEGWRKATPKDFLFSVKASRFLTHNKKLKEPHHALENFLPRAEALGRKLGPILFQLPPKWRVNVERFAEFLEALPTYHRYTFEFREPTWEHDEIYALLRKHNAAYCIYELAGYVSPLQVTTDFVYVRLHGPTMSKYAGSYSSKALAMWAARIEKWTAERRSVFIYFDNDQAGYAAKNALELKRTLGIERERAA